jgi:hypothetical protein
VPGGDEVAAIEELILAAQSSFRWDEPSGDEIDATTKCIPRTY